MCEIRKSLSEYLKSIIWQDQAYFKFHLLCCKWHAMVIFLHREARIIVILVLQNKRSRSSMDRMTDSGSVGWAFESPRDHREETAENAVFLFRIYRVYNNLGDENAKCRRRSNRGAQRRARERHVWGNCAMRTIAPGSQEALRSAFFYIHP